MQKMISNIVFTKNRPLQLEAYLESLYRHLPQELIQTYIIYKVELFDEQYGSVFRKFPNCIVIRETDFHSDFLGILSRINTEYILFGIDDVVFYDSVDFAVVDGTFRQQADDIFGFTLRFSPESLEHSNDVITDMTVAGQKVYRLDWRSGQTVHTRYPFELCCTVYLADTVRKIISGTMNENPLIRKCFSPSSFFIKALGKMFSTRSILKSFGYFFSPNTLESWNCRWCKNHRDQLPGFSYFQKLCASAIQVNMVNVSRKSDTHDGTAEHTVEALNEKYQLGFRLDIDFVAEHRPMAPGCGKEFFRLTKSQVSSVW